MSTPTGISAPPAVTVDELCGYLQRTQPGDTGALCDFARIFFAKVPRPLLQERSVAQLAALTAGAFRFVERGRPDRVSVEVTDPGSEGWSAPVTVIRAQLGDRPFIVDTIREFLNAQGIAIQHFIYPVLRVHRGPDGEVVGIGVPASGEGGELQSMVHCEVEPLPEAERAEIRAEIERRLTDVMVATADFDEMLAAADRVAAVVEGYAAAFPDRADDYREVVEFLRWLKDGHFVFLGYRGYDIVGTDGERAVQVEEGSGLGILRDDRPSRYSVPVPLSELPEELRRRVVDGPMLIINKAESESTVHRRVRMDYIGVKKLDDAGRVSGEQRFLGLFTSKAYGEHAEAIPILRQKLAQILASSGTRPGSHDYKEIITIFNSMPKEELFQASTQELEQEVQTVLGLLFSDEVRVVIRPDRLREGASVMVILPRGKYSQEARQRIQVAVTRHLGGTVVHYYLSMSAGEQARLHFYVSAPAETVQAADARALEHEVEQLTRSWEERLRDGLGAGAEAAELAERYAPALSEEYRAANTPAAAVHDVLQMERMRLEAREATVALRNAPEERQGELGTATVLKLYLRDRRLVLSDFMPILEDAGIRVIEIDTFSVAGAGLPRFMIYSFLVQEREGGVVTGEIFPILAEMLLAVWTGDAPEDPFNALVLRAGLRWREVDVLRTYANYATQIGAVPTRTASSRAMARYPEVARLLVRLFRARFDPAAASAQEEAALRGGLNRALEAVTSLADDRALRRLAALVVGTVRTNYYRCGGADPTKRSGGAPYISVKIRSAEVEELKKSRLLYEVYVRSSRMEGIHLRAAPVSRGGIRWSDRPDDFRTEVLGLVTTQVVKNATIVPSGSKGGFITKRVFADREEMGREAAEQYRTLMRGLLDLTDNFVEGRVVPPEGVVRHDGDDPYLVVAADKGTAHLSDVANAVAAEYGFWLGDAFASGGSHGYDHKEEGITARGGWECVKRHFREMGKDIQKEPFTVAGIGDMSGDVFGNGMLLSRQIRLLAAFDHRHVFLDPDPDPATSFAERERLFALPRSSWDDYDRALLSQGGMIVPRASKAVPLTPQVRAALGLPDEVESLDGEGLIRAVLQAPVELLWNGGIGTYVKHSDETHADAGDTTNDPVRVNADELRCRVVGEGGNLGFTQRGRIQYAVLGGRINTDALDNSAGVDMSDHEVNLKILLNRVVRDGDLTEEGRNTLLEAMTDEVSRLVLRNNFGQSLAVSLDQARSREALDDFAVLTRALERDGRIDRVVEGIPSLDQMQERAQTGLGLTRPTLSVLLAHAKLYAKSHLLASALPDDPALEPYLEGYFPREAVEAAGSERLREHQLRREIVTTELVNDLVNLMGSSFLHRVAHETGSEIPAVVRGWVVAAWIAGAEEIRADLAAAEGRFPAEVVYRWVGGLARVLEATTHWVMAHVPAEASTASVIEELRAGLASLRGSFAVTVTGEDRKVFLARLGELQDHGVERALAERLITLRFLPQLLDVLKIARDGGADPVEASRAYYRVSECFATAELRQTVLRAAGDGAWEKRYAQALAEDVAQAQRSIVQAALRGGATGEGVDAALAEFTRTRAREVQAYRGLLEELRADERAPLAGWAMAVRVLRGIAG
ncbi:MAG TPA: NAD-glutamate dehydrogenase [Longimicrobiaceae bacterium]|nr:NAD-glutamate dehydrogenase [Longimicrobiaceae bacterium]